MMRRLRHWHERRRHPQRYARLAQLLPVQALPRSEVLRRQRADLEAIVRFAASETDYYAARLAARLPAPQDGIDVASLPLLDKHDVREHRDAMLVRGADPARVRIGHTGGSTGQPLAFFYDDAKHQLMLAGMLRGFMMSGWRPGQRVLYFWGAPRDVAPGGVFGRCAGGLLDAERAIGALEYSEAGLRTWVDTIRRWRPVLLYGYASALSELARFIVDQRLVMPRSLLGVYSTAELLHAWQRELMTQAFGCRVFNQYGCREVPNIAWECRHGRMHVFADMVYLESVPVDGEPHLVVTSLTNRLMPFVRYDLGDTGELLDGECDCGLPFPLMRMDMCRHNDLIRTPSGTRVHPAYFNRLLYGLTQIRQYQWVQASTERLLLKLVAGERLSGGQLAAIESSIRRDLGPGIRLEVNYVAQIARSASGKHRFVIGLPDAASRPGRDTIAVCRKRPEAG